MHIKKNSESVKNLSALFLFIEKLDFWLILFIKNWTYVLF